MFESRRTTQCEQIDIIWNKREVFLLSLFCKERAESFRLTVQEDVVIIELESETERLRPVFGPQQYFDPRQGAAYMVRLSNESGCSYENRTLSIYQHKDWWIRPGFFHRIEDLPQRTQLFLMQDGADYFVLLAVCGKNHRSDMQGSPEGILVTVASNAGNRQRIDDISLVMSAGRNPYECCQKAVKSALRFLGRTAMQREERSYPAMFDKLGWCSWDAFYQAVSHRGILDKLQEFAEKKLPLAWVLIDDGWLDADYDQMVLKGFDARKENFPQGLAGCVREIKEKYGIQQVGVWHAIMGYWNGLEKGSRAEAAYQDEVERLPDDRILPAVDAGKAFRFFDQWHSYLRNKCGIDFVKVDGQSAISLAYAGLHTYGRASSGIQKGLNASAALHFRNQIINCMGMAAEDMWNRPSSAIARNSDDFVPEAEHGFWEHALQNAYNSLLQGQFFYGDWDMFFSDHADNGRNSMLRAVSGGPVYVSDQVGRTDPRYILPLILKDGTILRCEAAGQPTVDCLFENPLQSNKPFKIFNRYQDAVLVAAFHLGTGKCCEGSLALTDILLTSGDYIVYAWKTGELYCLQQEAQIPIILGENESELFYILPAKGDFLPLGILEKYLPGSCIEVIYQRERKWMFRITESGTFGFVSHCKPQLVRINTETGQPTEKEKDFYQLELKQEEEYIVEIIL